MGEFGLSPLVDQHISQPLMKRGWDASRKHNAISRSDRHKTTTHSRVPEHIGHVVSSVRLQTPSTNDQLASADTEERGRIQRSNKATLIQNSYSTDQTPDDHDPHIVKLTGLLQTNPLRSDSFARTGIPYEYGDHTL